MIIFVIPNYLIRKQVCVLSEGHMVFFGEAREARKYFIDMGWEAEERMTTADFLVSGTFSSSPLQ